MNGPEQNGSGPAVAEESAPTPAWALTDEQGEAEQIAVRKARLEGLRARLESGEGEAA
jgi:hypothetical protein